MASKRDNAIGGVKRRASSTDVARLAGVSQSAVSRAFTPGAAISDKTRRKVEKAADELDYKPNALARSLITSKTNIVALLTGDLQNPFYARIVNEISLRFQEAAYHVLLFSVSENEKADAAVSEVLKYRVDGVMLTSAELSSQMIEACQRLGTPVVLYNRRANDSGVSSVRLENVESSRRVADFLVDSGYERIAYLAGSDVDGTNADRERGFVERLAERGHPLKLRAQGDYSFESGREAFAGLWKARAKPDAVFCVSDRMAFGAMDAARFDLGLKVPGDVAIVGFDDLPTSSYPSYQLTTIRQPVRDMAHAAVDLLLAKIEAPDTMARTVLLPGELIVRTSAPNRRK